MSLKYPIQCIGHEAAGTEGTCRNLTGKESGKGRKNPYWCPTCDEARIAYISAEMDKVKKALESLNRE